MAHSDKTTDSATRKKLKVGRLPDELYPPLPSNWSPWDHDNKGSDVEAAQQASKLELENGETTEVRRGKQSDKQAATSECKLVSQSFDSVLS